MQSKKNARERVEEFYNGNDMAVIGSEVKWGAQLGS
jgi:hypothetical protein